ncbi:MAG: stage II sporulation protein P [Agathobacter sp.]|nr:stage II sporulation protein P [Agathobacter sp.]
MRRIMLILIMCSLICVGAYRWGDTKWENGQKAVIESLYLEVSRLVTPSIYTNGKSGKELVYTDMERFFVPLVSEFRTTRYEAMKKKDVVVEDIFMKEEDMIVNEDTEIKEDEPVATKPQESITEKPEESVQTSGEVAEKVVVINRGKLQEFDYLRQNFYQVDNTTTVGSDLLDVNQLLGKDMTLKENVEGPQILIYHTHSQEGYKDSIPGDPATSVVGVGDYLEQLLEQKYGIEVLHHKGVYDLPSRDNAYSSALPNIEKVLQENPTIEVVIDLHRDGIAEDRHLITEVNGKPTAKIMFFNGLSKTTSQGALDYLPNPYIADNLALSFQMQLTAAEYYPGLTRKIYLKGYRYNLHLCPKSVLVEVGAQTNTFEEAKNAMEPLADILGKVVYNGIYKE